MFYKQSITNIQVVVLSLDGGLLDLNRLRYNYYRRLCKHYGESVNRFEFSEQLGNMNTMYAKSPIQEQMPNTYLNEVVEKDLFAYAKLKPDIQKDGIEELLQFFIQRNIKVVVVSTHKTKRAIQYLQLTRLHKYVDFVIGGDSECAPLPDIAILELICHQMGVTANDVLVVANFPSLLTAANKMLMNVVYVPDLAPTSPTIEASVYRVAKNPLEIINLFLFAKYDTVEMFSPLLGMSAKMDLDTLHQTYNQLLKEYADDESLTRLVKQTYQYFLMEIQDKNRNTSNTDEVIKEELTKVEDVPEETSNIEEVKVEDRQSEIERTAPLFMEEEELETLKEQKVLTEPIHTKVPSTDDALARQKDFVTQATSLSMLMDEINENGNPGVKDDSISEEKIDTEEELSTFMKVWNYIVDFLYTTMLSVIIVLTGMICYIIGGDFLESKGVVSSIVSSVVNGYVGFITMVYRILFNGLHSILTFIPDYESLLTNSPLASKTGMETILYIIFHILLIYIFRWILNKIKTNEEYEK
ncbi:MAG: HAD family hydrolase [Coprobacillaceae bacterium]